MLLKTKKKNIIDIDYIVQANKNEIMIFTYNARFRVKKQLLDNIFASRTVTLSRINDVNRYLKSYNLIARLIDIYDTIYHYEIITIDKFNKENKPQKIKFNLSTLDLSDLD